MSMELKKYRLGEICEIYGRIGFRGYTTMDLAENENDGAITLSPSNIENGEISFARNTYLKWDKFYESPEIILEKGDVVLVKTGSSIGKTALVRDIPHPITLNPQFVVLKKIKADSTFLSYVLKGEFFQKSLDAITVGSTIPTLSQENLSNISIFLPSIENQHCIAAILTSIDRKIALNRAINRNLEALAKQLYDYWFVQFDFPDENGKPYKSSGGKMVWNEVLKRDVPEGWEVKRLRDLINLEDFKRVPLSSSQRANQKGSIPYYGATGIMDYIDDYIFDYDILLLAEDGSTSDGNGFPVVQYVWGKVWVNNHAHIIIPKDKKDLIYTYYMLKSIPVKLIETGSIQKKISQENLLNHRVLVVPEIYRSRYADIVDAVWERRKHFIEEITSLTIQRDELLPLLMNGQVEVGN